MNYAIHSYANKVTHKNKLLLFGIGGSNPTGKIRTFEITFISYQEVDIPQARTIAVELIRKFVDHVNNNKNLIPYLECYPINEKNFILSIGFKNSNSCFVDPPCIAHIISANGVIYYSINKNKFAFDTIYEETYEEALNIVRMEDTATFYHEPKAPFINSASSI